MDSSDTVIQIIEACHPLDGLVRLGSLYYCQSRQKDPMPNKLCLFLGFLSIELQPRVNSSSSGVVGSGDVGSTSSRSVDEFLSMPRVLRKSGPNRL